MRINDPKYLGSPADVARGLRVGALLGGLFAIREVISATHRTSLEPSSGNPLLLGAVVLLGGIVAGAVVGAFRPLARRFPVAIALGFIAVFPVLVAVDAIRSRITFPIGDIRWGVDAVSALIIGSLGAVAVRSAGIAKRSA